jgi:xylulokinase
LFLIGVDIGTSSTKGVLVDQSGRIVASHRVAHGVDRPHPSWAEQDADVVWWGEFAAVARALMSNLPHGGRVVGVGVSGTCPTLVPVSHTGKALRPGILYSIDHRALSELGEIKSLVGEKEIRKRSGNALSTQCIGPKILWLKRHEPEIYERTQWFLGTHNYVVWRLTGEACWDHFSAGDGGYGYDFRNWSWDADALSKMGIDSSKLPPLRWSTELIGTVQKQASTETGIPEGTPVIVGTGDAAAEMVSTGVVDEGSVALLYGSTLVTMLPVKQPYVSDGFILTPGLEPGSYLVSSVLGTGCALVEWLRDLLGWDGRLPGYSLLEAEASLVPPGSDGLTVLPYLSGQRSPMLNLDMHGAILGMNQSHHRGHIYRAILEGLAFALRACLSELENAGLLDGYQIIAAGGGSHSKLWTQIMTNVCHREQKLLVGSVQAPVGSAYLAGKAVGVVQPQDLQEWAKIQETVHVQRDVAVAYDGFYDRFSKYLNALA